MDVFVYRPGRMHIKAFHVFPDRIHVQNGPHQPRGNYCLDFRGENEFAVLSKSVIEGLLSEPVPGAKQLLRRLIPNSESEHPRQAPEQLRSIFIVECENDFGIRGGAKRIIGKERPDILVSVDFAVKRYGSPGNRRNHRLAARAQIDDTQSRMPQDTIAEALHTPAIRPTMPQGIQHPVNGRLKAPSVFSYYPSDSAHIFQIFIQPGG